MLWSRLLPFLTVLLVGNAATVKEGGIGACNPSLEPRPGFDIEIFSLPITGSTVGQCYDKNYDSNSYLHGGYRTYKYGQQASSSNVTNFYYSYSKGSKGACAVTRQKLPSYYNLDQSITITNFSMLASGYFTPKLTGTYKFNFRYIDDVAWFNLGAGNAFNCCEKTTSVDNPGSFLLTTKWPDTSSSVNADLIAGYSYPMRFFYAQRNGDGGIKFTFSRRIARIY